MPSDDRTLLPVLLSFDLFKFFFWLVLPFCILIRRMEWSWFSVRAYGRREWLLLLLLMFLAGGAVIVGVYWAPSLQKTYPLMRHLSLQERLTHMGAALVWTASWLFGWEFLHRYVLLRAAVLRFPRFGWLLVPLSEFLYHLQKPGLEALGMIVFSLIVTWWTIKYRNILFSVIAHLYIEIILIALLFLS